MNDKVETATEIAERLLPCTRRRDDFGHHFCADVNGIREHEFGCPAYFQDEVAAAIEAAVAPWRDLHSNNTDFARVQQGEIERLQRELDLSLKLKVVEVAAAEQRGREAEREDLLLMVTGILSSILSEDMIEPPISNSRVVHFTKAKAAIIVRLKTAIRACGKERL